MDLKIIKTKIGQGIEIDISYYCGAEVFCINALMGFLNKAKDKGATHLDIRAGVYDYIVDDIEIQPVKVETESVNAYRKRKAEEMGKRLAEDRIKKAKEKALYEELKLKYGEGQ